VIDATSPLDFSGGVPPKLAVSGNDSAGEQVQRLLPDACVVRVFNTVGNAFMFQPDFPGGPLDMFIAGDSDDAKKKVKARLCGPSEIVRPATSGRSNWPLSKGHSVNRPC
jgi:predicted dinucleotide-binding enzyme